MSRKKQQRPNKLRGGIGDILVCDLPTNVVGGNTRMERIEIMVAPCGKEATRETLMACALQSPPNERMCCSCSKALHRK